MEIRCRPDEIVVEHPRIKWNEKEQQWYIHLDGPGMPVISCRDKQTLEDFLDYVDNRNQ